PEVLAFTRVPGSFGYSGEGFEVLLQALCRRAGQPAGELLDQVLARFGMRASSFRWRPAFADTAAIPHDADGRSLTKQRPGQARAAGSLHTTLADYSAFALMVLNEGADDIFEPAVVLDDSHGRSLGWGTVRTDAGIVAWQHGDNQGFKHLVGLRRARGDGIVIFTNGDDGRVLCRAAFRKVLGAQSW
ncbi:MAG TPA: serine hydrolase domain-containing protein, partial [Streptosporangiaceae bacterium]